MDNGNSVKFFEGQNLEIIGEGGGEIYKMLIAERKQPKQLESGVPGEMQPELQVSCNSVDDSKTCCCYIYKDTLKK